MFYIFICSLLWSFGGLFVRLAGANPFTVSGIRSLLALPVVLLFSRPGTLRFNKKVWLSAIWLTATGVLFTVAVSLTTAANAIVLQYSTPVFIVIANRLFYHERVRRSDVCVTIVCLAGMALFFLDELSPGNMLGNFVAVLSGVTNAGIFITMNRTGENRDAIAAASYIEGTIVCLPFMIMFPPQLALQPVLALLSLGLVQRGLSLVVFARASKFCSSMDASIISMAEPLLTPVWVMLALGERPGRFALAGAAVILSAVFAWNYVNVREAKAEAA